MSNAGIEHNSPILWLPGFYKRFRNLIYEADKTNKDDLFFFHN